MKSYKVLNISGALLDKNQLEKYLEKVATNHNLKLKSEKQTYPIPRMLENYQIIKQVYNLLNQHLKLGINIHPAGEWLLDNFYIIEETIKSIQKELPLKKYVNFLGLQNGYNKGFARIYVLAAEIVAYTDNKIQKEDLEKYLEAYQTKKTLSMDEIWNIGIFLEIAIIEKIREICEKIYVSQLQKYKVENIVERLVEKKDRNQLIFKTRNILKIDNNIFKDMKYPFIEYMSYVLKRYGKKANSYLKVLEEEVEKTGTTVSEVIKKEHFDIAVRKVSIGNSIISLKSILRINFLEIFEKINGVEEILKQDPANVYDKMDYKTKEYYRNVIKQISKKTKISEMYIAKKILELACDGKNSKERHIGYYLIDDGINLIYEKLGYPNNKKTNEKTKAKMYVFFIYFLSFIISILIAKYIDTKINNIFIGILTTIILIIPISELIVQLIQYILSKIVKPKIIPKLDFYNGIDKQNSTIVIIPTILNSKKKVKELMEKLEVFYLANKSENLYFALLGDCTQSDKEKESFDDEVIDEGLKQSEILNKKYGKENNEIFYFLYRNRVWNPKESSYLGWERKRGLINQFNEYVLGNSKDTFRANTMTKIPKIKYVITLDSDTDLILNSAFELVGAMAHVLNKPEVDSKTKIVTKGYGIIQPRVGVNLNISYKNLFTKIFAGVGGIDSYTNAISDIYQDNFGEGIFTGKGIYDLKVFSEVLSNAFPEDTILSHDLLEGSYLRCGLATDILLMDGYPTKYISFMNRLSRWIRGDWQISKWITKTVTNGKEKIKNPLSFLSKYKIFDNLRRSVFEILLLIGIIYLSVLEQIYSINLFSVICFLVFILIFPFVLEIANVIILKKEGEQKQATFTPKINGLKGSIIRAILTLGCIPYKAYISCISICKTIYRKYISHINMLEWMTSEDAEKLSKTDVTSYYKIMAVNSLLGIISLIYSINKFSILGLLISILWIITPLLMCYISKEKSKKTKLSQVSKEDREYIYEIGKKTWQFFKDNLNQKNNYLIPDNYQENRIPIIINRTSSTNIGLSLLSVISSYDLKYSTLDETIKLLKNMIKTIDELSKWNGHLYNWYNTETKEPLHPRYISTVDSGNFVGYLYVTKQFLLSIINYNFKIKKFKKNKETIKYYSKNKLTLYKINHKLKYIDTINLLLNIIDKIIEQTDFNVLYSSEQRLFSIGFNIEENKLTDSYYDLLASEARQASLIAIAKKDVPAKHWNNLSRTLTTLGKYKGLISWSGTAFEYLMPNVNMPKYEGSLLDESSKFLIMSQMEYCKKLGIPWGISESAFNLKDLHSNYQYKAFGIPWLGLKRGLADEMVVSSYGSILAINEVPNEVIKNLRKLESLQMNDIYGFFESIDFTPTRLRKGEIASPVKTYMAHHQGLILLSINNLINNNILQKRFVKNPEIEAVTILLQERMPETSIITKENKEKVEKLKYKDYENYSIQVFNKIEEKLTRGNVISNEDYTIAINQKGIGFSKYKDIYINRHKKTDDYAQGIFFYIKNIRTKKIWSSNYNDYTDKPDKYSIKFMPDQDEIERIDGNIKSTIKITTSPDDPVEIRRLELKNTGNEEEILEISSYFEPVLSSKEQDYAHQAFNNLFLIFEYDDKTNNLIIKRKKRAKNDEEIYLATQMFTECEIIGENEFEIDKEKFIGRGNLGIPKMIKQSIPFSKKIGLVTEPIAAQKKTIKIHPQETIYIDLILSINNNREKAIYNLEKYSNSQKVKRAFDLSRAKVEEENRYLDIKGKDIEIYQKILSYIVFDNPIKKQYIEKIPKLDYKQENLWKYGISGDLPILLVKIKDINDIYVIKQIIKAYEFFRSKNIQVELVILDEEKHSYENYVREEIEATILNNHVAYLKNIKGGIFVLSKSQMDDKDVKLLELLAVINLDSHCGDLKTSIKDLEDEYLEKYKDISDEEKENYVLEEKSEDTDILSNTEDLMYYNEYGAFSKDGKEYFIRINKENKLPTVWSHIMANEKIGTVVTENMGGYTWNKNSRLNRITAWNNSPCMDIPSEVIYLKDDKTGKSWSIGCNPKPDDNNYNIVYGFGYAKYIHNSLGLIQELETFIPKEDPVKVNILNLNNTTPNKKKIKLIYYIKPVIGEDELKSDEYIYLNYESSSNVICARKSYNNEFNNLLFISSSEKIKSYTGDKKFFLGNGGLQDPAGLKKISLDNNDAYGKQSCVAIEIEVEIDSFSSKKISLVLGANDNIIDAKNLSYKYSKINNCNLELENVKKYWEELLGKVKVETPIESTNILLNGWLMYQTIVSRLIGRSGFYQSGGAFGFRDQLQDTFGAKYLNIDLLKQQIIKHSKHQFIEGDVEHWWHEETNKGIRTRFSDDLLWLAYAVIEYINFTGDKSILDIETNYIKGNILQENVDEKYDEYIPSEIKESIYMHCIRAIDKSLNFGERGLPKIGSGDWNDGFSEVGNKGKGESIWLGFFLYYILDNFINICLEKNDIEKKEQYEIIKNNLKKALNTNGWDGRWFKRAYMDDGNILGSMENEECRIDSIAQSWGIISNAADNDKRYISMESLENHLIDRENGIIKLLDPPFEKSKLEPGYIKSYMPGVRENGGQYTHASCWVIIAQTLLGFGDKALELYKIINPIEHSRTKDASTKYKVEPFVVAADIYGAGNLAGRGGWTWYTGSSSWYYKAGIEYILGLKIEKGVLKINPCIPKDWKEYFIRYKYENSIYNIKVKNPNGKNTGVDKIYLDGNETENMFILDGTGKIFNIEVIM